MTRELATTSGEIRKGRLLVRSWERFSASFSRRRDCDVLIRIERIEEHPSKEIAGYLWGVVYVEMAKESGHSVEDLHTEMKLRFLSRTVTLVNQKTGEVAESTLPGSTKRGRISADRYAVFVNEVIKFANDFFRLQIPEADPNWRTNKLSCSANAGATCAEWSSLEVGQGNKA